MAERFGRPSLSTRPELFRLDYRHPLAKGLIFGWFGTMAPSITAFDSSLYRQNLTFSDAQYLKQEFGRWKFDSSQADNATGTVNAGVGTGNFTWAAWYYWSNPAGSTYHGLIGWDSAGANDPSLIARDVSGTKEWNVRLNSFGETVYENSWHHVGMIRRSGTCYLYHDGVAAGTPQAAGTVSMASAGFHLGSAAASNYFFIGSFADAMFWNYDIGAAQMRSLANPSDVMYGGLLLPPARKWWPVKPAASEGGALLLLRPNKRAGKFCSQLAGKQ